MNREYAVIGLGRFGRAVALHLVEERQSVMAVDRDEDRAQLIESKVDAVVIADATSEEALEELRLEGMGCVIVAMGPKAKDSSILVTALLRQRGAPRIVARAFSDLHARVLQTVGAHEVVNPEADMARRLARSLAQPHVLDQFLLDTDHTVAELEVPESFVGQDLESIDLPNEHSVTPLLLRRGGGVIAAQDLDGPLETGDVLVVMGNPEAVRRFASMA
jgi:trk system potassium uptake protein TrkA